MRLKCESLKIPTQYVFELEGQSATVKSQLCHLLAVWLWVSEFIALNLSFHDSQKMG